MTAGFPRGVVGGLAVSSFAIWLLVAVAHADDAFGNDKVSGTWLVLGKAADEGTLYPPLYDGEQYGGTRWMPLPILAYALAHRIGGDGYWTAKLLVYVTGVALLAVLYLALRAVGVPRDIGAGLVAVVLLVPVGFDAVTTIAGDALPTLVQLGALLVVYRHRERLTAHTVVLAAVLAALGLLAKLSAVWGPLAILLVLSFASRRLAVVFAAVTTALVASGAAATELVSEGRFSENLTALAFAGSSSGAGQLAIDGPTRFMSLLQSFAGGIWLLVPLAILALFRSLDRRRLTAFELGLLLACVVTVVVLADRGAYTNHLLDVVVLVPVVAGSLCGVVGVVGAWASTLLRATIVVALAVALATDVRHDAREALTDLRGGSEALYGAEQLRGAVPPGATLLAQDPGVPYALGRRPVVTDAFMLPRIAATRPEAIETLRRRIEDQEFDLIVLVNPVTHPPFYGDGDFGPRLASTLCRRYRESDAVGGYLVYVPAGDRHRCPEGL